MRKIIPVLMLVLSTFSYGSVMYVAEEEELKNIFTIGLSSAVCDVLVIPSQLLKNLSDENKAEVKKLHAEKKCEFAGTSYTEVVLPALLEAKLENDAREQIEKGKIIYYEIFGVYPPLFYPYMGVISKSSAGLLKQSGYSVVLTSAGLRADLENATADVSPQALYGWRGSPVQNLAWNYILQARAKLDDYANSKAYNSEKFNAALEELYNLEKPVWFENYVSADSGKKKENDLWFRAGLSNVYRAIGSELPPAVAVPLFLSSSSSPLTDTATGDYLVYFADDSDNVFLSSCSLTAFGVRKSSGEIVFDIFVSSVSGETIDIYIDMNKKNNAGSTEFLSGREGFTDSVSAWEYAVSVSTFDAKFYRYSRTGTPVKSKTFAVNNSSDKNLLEVVVPERYILGNPKNWGYIVAGFLPSGNIFDILGTDVMPPGTIIQVPALRVK